MARPVDQYRDTTEAEARREAIEFLRAAVAYGETRNRIAAAKVILDATAPSRSVESAPAVDPVVGFLRLLREAETVARQRVIVREREGGDEATPWEAFTADASSSCWSTSPAMALAGLVRALSGTETR